MWYEFKLWILHSLRKLGVKVMTANQFIYILKFLDQCSYKISKRYKIGIFPNGTI